MNVEDLPKIIRFLREFFLCVGIMVLFSGYLSRSHEKSELPKVHLGFAGDVMLGRLVDKTILKKSYIYPWGSVLPLMRKKDIMIVNLETTLTKSNQAVPKVFNFKSDPANVRSLVEGNIGVVNIANNHILDFGYQGLVDTLKTLDGVGIKHVGAGLNEKEARKPVIITKKGITFGILGYTDNEPTWVAHNDKYGTNYVKVGNISKIQEDIAHIRGKVDFVVIALHWGPNMRQRPTQEFIDFAHAIIDSGADIIHGSSAHIFQGIEIYHDKLIMYDTGDFVDDYMVDHILRNDRSFLYQVVVDKTGIKNLELVPVIIENMQVNLAPLADAQESLQRIRDLSAEFGTKISEKGTWKPKNH